MAVETKTRNAGPINSITKYYKDIKSEFKKITWPSGSEIIKATQNVLIVIAIFTLILWLYDSVFGYALQALLKIIE